MDSFFRKLKQRGKYMCYNESIIWQYFARYTKFLTAGCLVFAFGLLLFVPRAALANDLFEDRAWQFETTTERAQKAAILDLIERKKAGMYNNTYNSTYNSNSSTDYNISGDYIDCNMTSQATGNQGGITQNVPVGSPTIGVNSSTSSSASGNSGTGTIATGGNTSNTGLTSQKGDTDSVSNTSTAGGTNSVSNSQSNNGSTQNSSANGNAFSSTVSGVSGTGGGASVALNSTQSLANSPVSSSISRSKACDFNTVSGSIGSPINSGGGK
jgi:hypothetical protein